MSTLRKNTTNPSNSGRPRSVSTRFIVLLIIAGTLLGLAGVVASHVHRSYTSDDVAQQVMLKGVTDDGDHTLYFGPDSFFIKFPLYTLNSVFFWGERTNLLILNLLLSGIGIALYLIFAVCILKYYGVKRRLSYLALLWPILLGSLFYSFLTNPNLRNLEIGLAFGFLAAAVAVLHAPRVRLTSPRTILSASAAVVALGVFIYSDPYFLYSFFLPLLLALGTGLLLKNKVNTSPLRDNTLIVLGIIITATLFSYLLRPILSTMGVVATNEVAEFTLLQDLLGRITLGVDSLLSTFNANVFGKPVVSLATILSVLGLIPLCIIGVGLAIRRIRAKILEFLPVTFALYAIILTFALFSISTNSIDATSARYFVLMPFFAALLCAFVVEYASLSKRYALLMRRSMVVFLVSASALFVVTNSILILNRTQSGQGLADITKSLPESVLKNNNYKNSLDQEVANILEAHGLTKGYAEYWDTHIVTFLSKSSTHVVPVVCDSSNLVHPYLWLTDSYYIQKPSEDSRSYFIYNPKRGMSSSQEWCGHITSLERQFGQPQEVIPVRDGVEILVYNYDLLDAMPKS